MNSNQPKSRSKITCAEFQEQLPDLFAAGGNGLPEDPDLREHLKNCENCAALMRDLQYIADQASLLLQPTHEPSDNVWKKIQAEMNSERAHSDHQSSGLRPK